MRQPDPEQPCDLLLLNTSNYHHKPRYPYAFTQVSEVARRFGVKVVRYDMLMFDHSWDWVIRNLIATHRPRMVGLHIRQNDTIVSRDYLDHRRQDKYIRTFFPIENSRRAVEVIRDCSDAPIVLGGIGFTTHTRMILDYLGADFGVQGSPDEFFERFEDALAGRELETIPNLIFKNSGGYQSNRRAYHSPTEGVEYNDEIVNEVFKFYGTFGLSRRPFAATGDIMTPVEIMRGCPCKCAFCVEPMVKGKGILRRKVDSIMADVEFLYSRNLSHFWFVCSELNLGGMGFALELGEALVKFQEGLKHKGPPIVWRAFALPTIKKEIHRQLRRTGFRIGWNEIMVLDDDVLRKTQVPYTSRSALRSIIDMGELMAEDQADPYQSINFFFGGQHVTARSIALTLAKLDEADTQKYYNDGFITTASRVFDVDRMNGVPDHQVTSINEDGPMKETNLMWPSFHYPQEFLDHLGSIAEVEEFFYHALETYFSTMDLTYKDWLRFLPMATSVDGFLALTRDLSFEDVDCGQWAAEPRVVAGVERLTNGGLRRPAAANLFGPLEEEAPLFRKIARILIDHVLGALPGDLRRVFDHLGLPYGDDGRQVVLSNYKMARLLYDRYDSVEALVDDVVAALEPDPEEMFRLRHFIFYRNLLIRQDYRPLLFVDDDEAA